MPTFSFFKFNFLALEFFFSPQGLKPLGSARTWNRGLMEAVVGCCVFFVFASYGQNFSKLFTRTHGQLHPTAHAHVV
jgi:hypothetical protein